MIRPDANIFDMTLADLTDTLPVIARDITEWKTFSDNTLSEHTVEICTKKIKYLTNRHQQMENRLANLNIVSSNQKGCPFDEILH